jgi:hypothetical protein
LARNDEESFSLRHINPTGKSLKSLSIPSRKNIPLAPSGKSVINSARLTRYEGRIAIVTNARWDAVDAEGVADVRAGCVRRSRVVLTPRCWRQTAQVHSCAATVAKEPFTGESTK